MQLLYVTDFIIESKIEEGIDGTVEATLVILGEWAGDPDEPISAYDLLGDGTRELRREFGASRKFADWNYLTSPAGDWVTRLDVVTTDGDGVHFTTRVTVGVLHGNLRLRLSLSREMDATGLSPAADPVVRQPRVLTNLAESQVLRDLSSGQVVKGEFLQARGHDLAVLVAEVLQSQNRLPVFIVHSRTREAQKNVLRAASGLIGLVRIITVDLATARKLLTLQPQARVPYAGGLLVWSDFAVPTTAIGQDVVNSDETDILRTRIMSLVAPLSALTRGNDDLYKKIREASRVSRVEAAAARTAAAVETGSSARIIRALTEERDQFKSDYAYAIDGWTESEAAEKESASVAARWKATAEQLEIAQQYAGAAVIDDSDSFTFDNTPNLLVKDLGSLEKVTSYLEEAADGHIVFTGKVQASWKKADHYSTPDMMRAALIKLAQVARDLYDGQHQITGHPDTWMRENYDLKASLQDDRMPKGFEKFQFEGRDYDRTPHVKVNDGVPSHDCGRIYFAFDGAEGRIIVDHVGLHY